MNINAEFKKFKHTATKIKEDSVAFIKEHQHEILKYGLSAISIVMYVKMKKSSKSNEYLLCKNEALNNTNSQLIQRITELESLCSEKDRIMDKTMSDGLRCRSSEAGRQMANKRYYLNSLNS